MSNNNQPSRPSINQPQGRARIPPPMMTNDYVRRQQNSSGPSAGGGDFPARQRIIYNPQQQNSVFDGRRLSSSSDNNYNNNNNSGSNVANAGAGGKRPRMIMSGSEHQQQQQYNRSSPMDRYSSGQQQRRSDQNGINWRRPFNPSNPNNPSGNGGGGARYSSGYVPSSRPLFDNQYKRPPINSSSSAAVSYSVSSSSSSVINNNNNNVENSPSSKGPVFVSSAPSSGASPSVKNPDIVRVRAIESSLLGGARNSRASASGEDDMSTDNDSTNDEEDGATSDNDDEEEEDVDVDEGAMTKEKITDSMDLIDDEISKYEAMLETLQRQKRELSSSRPASPVLSVSSPILNSNAASPRITKAQGFGEVNLVQRILKENRAKAKKASSMAQLKMPTSSAALKQQQQQQPLTPVYTQPSDLPFYKENLDNHALIRDRLIQKIREREESIVEKTVKLSVEFDQMYRDWQDQVLRWESAQRKKQDKLIGKQGLMNFKKRMLIAQQTEEQPLSHLAIGEYDPTVLPFTYLFPHEDFRFLKTLSKVPDMIMDDRERTEVKYIDHNRLFEDSLQSIRNRNNLNPWTFAEKEVFLQRFVEFPKQFGKIAAYLPNKTAQDCVLFYYLNKKPLKLKSMIKAHGNYQKKLQKKTQMMAGNSAGGGSGGQSIREPVSAQPPVHNYEHHLQDQLMEDVSASQSPIPVSNDIPPQSAGNSTTMKYVEFEESFWDPTDLQRAKEFFLDIGKDFAKISEKIGSKSIMQVRNLFLAYKRELGIDLSSAESIADGGSRNERKRSKQLRDRSRQASVAPEVIVEEAKVKPEKVVANEPVPPSVAVNPAPPEKADKKKTAKRGRPSKTGKGEEEVPDSPGKANNNTNNTSDAEGAKKDKKKHISYWTAKEKTEFMKHFGVHGKNWKALADAIPTKSENQIRNYYQNNKVVLGLNTGERSDQDEEGRKGASDQEESGGLPPMNLGYVLPPYPYPYPGPAPPPLSTDGSRYQPPSFPLYPPPIYTQGAPRPPPFMSNPFYPMPPPPLVNTGANGGKNSNNSSNGDSKQPFFPYGPLHFPHIAPQPLPIPSSIRPPQQTQKDANSSSPKPQPILPKDPGPPELSILPVPMTIPPRSPPKPLRPKRNAKNSVSAAVEAKKEPETDVKTEAPASVPMEIDEESKSGASEPPQQNETSQLE